MGTHELARPTKSESDSHSTDLDSEATLQVMKVLGMAGIVKMLHAIKQPTMPIHSTHT